MHQILQELNTKGIESMDMLSIIVDGNKLNLDYKQLHIDPL